MTDGQVWAVVAAVLSLGMSGWWGHGLAIVSVLLLLADGRERRRLLRDDPDERQR